MSSQCSGEYGEMTRFARVIANRMCNHTSFIGSGVLDIGRFIRMVNAIGMAFVQIMPCHCCGIDISLLAEFEPHFPDYRLGFPGHC